MEPPPDFDMPGLGPCVASEDSPVEIVMSQTQYSRIGAERLLKETNGDVIKAILIGIGQRELVEEEEEAEAERLAEERERDAQKAAAEAPNKAAVVDQDVHQRIREFRGILDEKDTIFRNMLDEQRAAKKAAEEENT